MFRRGTCLVAGVLGLLVLAGFATAFALLASGILSTPRVSAVEPAAGSEMVLPDSPITLTFSTPMARGATEAALRLSPLISGDWEWRNDRTLSFVPYAGLPISATVTIEVGAAARSRLGRPLAEPARFRFKTVTRPVLVDSTPALGAQFIYVPNRVSLLFSRALDAQTAAAQLKIEPPVPYQALEWDGARLNVSGFFAPATRYRLTLPADVTDAEYGVPLGRELVWSFTTATQYPNFSILNRDRVLTAPADEPLKIPTQFTNVSRLDVALYPLTRDEFETNRGAPYETWAALAPTERAVRRQSVSTDAELDRYMTRELVLTPVPAGTYLLEVTTPEGPSDKQLVSVTK